MQLKIEYKPIEDLKKYQNNAKIHTKEQIKQIEESIKQFGMNDPIGIWKDNTIIEGHGRLIACSNLGFKEVPVIKLEHLTDEERKAYILAHNKLTMNTDFDFKLLDEELKQFETIDMSKFDFDINADLDIEEEIQEEKENERVRTNNAYNLDKIDYASLTDYYEMPIIYNNNYIPKRLIGFNYAKSSKEKNVGIHFYIDDYQFERIWNNPKEYVDILKEYECVLSPDFSLYMDMPYPMKMWNIYRSRFIGNFLQNNGIKVIPTMSWAEEKTFDFCFEGIPKGSIVSVSTIGVKRDEEAFKVWRNGMDVMIKRIEPSTILVYGGKLDYDYKGIKVIYFENEVTERMKNNVKV